MPQRRMWHHTELTAYGHSDSLLACVLQDASKLRHRQSFYFRPFPCRQSTIGNTFTITPGDTGSGVYYIHVDMVVTTVLATASSRTRGVCQAPHVCCDEVLSALLATAFYRAYMHIGLQSTPITKGSHLYGACSQHCACYNLLLSSQPPRPTMRPHHYRLGCN
jgi:hypothetical protein